MYDLTKKVSKRYMTLIFTVFKIRWKYTIWEDLHKPLYSALAAQLYLIYLSERHGLKIPVDVVGQAKFWAKHLKKLGDWRLFVSESKKIPRGKCFSVAALLLFFCCFLASPLLLSCFSVAALLLSCCCSLASPLLLSCFSVAALLLSCYCSRAVLLLLSCFSVAALLLSCCCFLAVLLLLSCFSVAAFLLLRCCSLAVLLLLSCCFVAALLLFCFCFLAVLFLFSCFSFFIPLLMFVSACKPYQT